MKYELKCNAPNFERFREYAADHRGATIAKWDFTTLQSIFEARGYNTEVRFRNRPLRGTIRVEIDNFYYYVELYKA